MLVKSEQLCLLMQTLTHGNIFIIEDATNVHIVTKFSAKALDLLL